ncbi:radical SAM protein [Gemmatimonadetes bacterium T265]|nr:radical SAM protein [Gemmatimonadetes bacterium T265]
MVVVDTVLLKVASRCNINCRYCYVFNMGDTGWSRSPKLMSAETCHTAATALGRLAVAQGRGFSVVLHGGEPLLLGLTRLRSLIATLRDALPAGSPIGIQTNGVLIDRDTLDACAEAGVTIAVSLDGPQAVHDAHRVGFNDAGTFDAVMRGLALLRAHPAGGALFTGLLAVIDPTSNPREVYGFFKALNPPSVDFIYRDGNHSRLPAGKRAIDTSEYGEWMVGLLDAYLDDSEPIAIRVLDDMIRMTLGGTGASDDTGVDDYGILIIDTDGTVTKNDTLKSVFDGADRFESPQSVYTHHLRDVVGSDEFVRSHAAQRPSSATCRACPYLATCGGGMLLHRWRNDTGYDNPSVYCADQRVLLTHIRHRLATVGVIS